MNVGGEEVSVALCFEVTVSQHFSYLYMFNCFLVLFFLCLCPSHMDTLSHQHVSIDLPKVEFLRCLRAVPEVPILS